MTGFIQSRIKNTRQLVMLDKLANTVTTVNQILAKNTGGVVIPATSSTVRSEIEGICNQTIAAAEALTQVPAIVVSGNDTFIVDTANATSATHNYQRMILTDSLTVNNTGTDDANGVVEQVEPYGLAADKKIVCRFL
jgi:hypothetical protein